MGRQMACPFACPLEASGEPNPFLKQTIYAAKRAGKCAGNPILKQTIYGSKTDGPMGRHMACPFVCPFEASGEPNPLPFMVQNGRANG